MQQRRGRGMNEPSSWNALSTRSPCRERSGACCMFKKAGRWNKRFELKYLTMRYPAVRLTASLFKWWRVARDLLCFTVPRWSRRQETCLYIHLVSAWVELNLALLTWEEEKQGSLVKRQGEKGKWEGHMAFSPSHLTRRSVYLLAHRFCLPSVIPSSWLCAQSRVLEKLVVA
jgi:hypothetical protein